MAERKAEKISFKYGSSQHKCGECGVRADGFKLKHIPQWIKWDNSGTVSSTKQEFGLHTI